LNGIVFPVYNTANLRHVVSVTIHTEKIMSHTVKEFDYSGLSIAERILLAQELWDSVHREALASPLSAEQRQRLDHRRAELESGAVAPLTWDELRLSLSAEQ